MSTQYQPPHPSLVGDLERDLVCDQLSVHHATGHLDQPEFERRMSVALQCHTRAELRETLSGLPSPTLEGHPPTRRSAFGGAEVLVLMVSLLALFCLLGVLGLAGMSSNDEVLVGLVLGACGGGAFGMGLVHLAHRLRS